MIQKYDLRATESYSIKKKKLPKRIELGNFMIAEIFQNDQIMQFIYM